MVEGSIFRMIWRKLLTLFQIIRLRSALGGYRDVSRNWKHLIWKWRAERLQVKAIGSDYVLVPNVNGFNMFVRSSDIGISQELLMSKVHEPIATTMLPMLVQSGDTVLEIGGNIGYYTLLLSQLVGEKGAVITVEPNPESFTLLKLNLRLNRVTNVELHQLAIGNKDGCANLYTSYSSNLCTLKPSIEGENISSIEVRTTTIDAFVKKLAKPVQVIRMDIEGLEKEALEGAEFTLEHYKPRLFIEFHVKKLGIKNAEMTLEFLYRKGYEETILILRDDDWPWIKRPYRIWRRSLMDILSDEGLMRLSKTFTLMIEAGS